MTAMPLTFMIALSLTVFVVSYRIEMDQVVFFRTSKMNRTRAGEGATPRERITTDNGTGTAHNHSHERSLTNKTLAVFLDAQARREEDGGRRSARMYGDYCTIVVTPLTAHHVTFIEQTIETQDAITSWSEDIGVNHKVELMLPSKISRVTLSALRTVGMEPEIAINSVGELLQWEHQQNTEASKRRGPNDILGRFATLEEIYAWMDAVAGRYRHVTVESIGTSFEGRPIKMLRLAKATNLPIFYLEGSPHSREWIGVAAVLYAIYRLLNPDDAQTSALAGTLEWQFVPTSNPDGYKYSHDHDRFWRKNRRTWPGEKCVGVDINRNWDYNFGRVGVSSSKCNECYPGPHPWSELETVALRDHFLQYKNGDKRIKAYLSLHAYSSLWLFPPGSGPKPPNFARLEEVAKGAADRVTMRHQEKFVPGAPGEILYPVSGASLDWVHVGGDVRYSYSPELRPGRESPSWESGFMLPVNQIMPACEETWEGLKYVGKVIAVEERETTGVPDFQCPQECTQCCKSSTRADHFKCILKQGASLAHMAGCLQPKVRRYHVMSQVNKVECVAQLFEDLSPAWKALPAKCT